MIFWIIALLMLVVAVLCVLLPLSRNSETQSAEIDALDVYRQQLAALENENPATDSQREALDQERVELSRLMLRYSRQQAGKTHGINRSKSKIVASSIMALLLLPVISIGTYLSVGSPKIQDQPLAARQNGDFEKKSVDEMVLIAERHLAKNPKDERGWQVLADVYGKLNRPTDRARALQELLQLSGSTPQLITELGEALTVAQGNIVPVEARKMFETALEQNQNLPKASFYLAIALEQEGKLADAYTMWQELTSVRKNDPRWQSAIQGRLSQLRTRLNIPEPLERPEPRGPTAADIENASKLSSGDREVMIEGMVSRLAERLKGNPDDIEGWTRLIRAYVVLKRPEKANDALRTAQSNFSNQTDALSKFDELSKQLGLKTLPDSEVKQ